MKYEVTIGIPVYRAAGYIEKTMESALCQTYPSIEFLVIDDCGGDGSIDVIERLCKNHPRGKDIRIFYHPQNLGVGMTRNHILNEAKGRYLYFLDSDDLIESDAIQLFVDKMKLYQADVVYGSLNRIDKVYNMPSQSYILPDAYLFSEDEFALYVFKNYNSFQISVCNCLMSVDFLRTHHLHFLDTVFWEDLAFTYDMAIKVKRAVFLSNITYHYLCRPGSLSHYQDRDQIVKSEIMKNVSTIDYLKTKCVALKDKSYLPYLCKNLEMNSFYIVCHILKHSKRIFPSFSEYEMWQIFHFPLPLSQIICFRHLQLSNLVLFLLSRIPLPLFIPSVRILGKLKRVL